MLRRRARVRLFPAELRQELRLAVPRGPGRRPDVGPPQAAAHGHEVRGAEHVRVALLPEMEKVRIGMEKVRIGMTDSTFFICREVEVRIRSE
mgnify:CR=1 FL=1